MIRIYFAGSIRGGRGLAERYMKLIHLLRSYGQVYTEHVGDDSKIAGDEGFLSNEEIHDRDMGWLRDSDLVVAEVSVPSLGVGYEIAMATELGKPVLCLYHKDASHRLSAMISGSSKLTVELYDSVSEAGRIAGSFIKEVVGDTPGYKS